MIDNDVIIKYMEDSVKLSKKESEMESLYDFVNIGFGWKDNIHVFKGIYRLAKAVGEEINVEDSGAEKYPLEFSFIWNGIRFFQLGSSTNSADLGKDEVVGE